MRIIAHRGYSYYYPENTLIAYEKARDQGYSYLECDIDFTRDGVPVLFHDDNLLRILKMEGRIGQYDYDELLEFDFGLWKGEEFRGTRILSYEEFLNFSRTHGLHPYVELKGQMDEDEILRILDLTHSYGFKEDISFISFSLSNLMKIRKLRKDFRLGLLGWLDENLYEEFKVNIKDNKNFLNLNERSIKKDSMELLKRIKEDNVDIEVWTVNELDRIEALKESFVTGITTDYILPL